MILSLAFVGLVSLSFCSAVHLPEGLTYCHKSDPKLNDCLKVAIQDGMKKFVNGNKAFGVPNLEPFRVDKIEIEGAKTGSVTLNQLYTNVDFHDTTNLEITKSNIDLEKCEWKLSIHNKVVLMKADYVLKGQILVFPINGQGKCDVTLQNLQAEHTIKCKRIEKNGNKYLEFTDYQLDLNPENVVYDFKRIIPGNEQITAEVLKTVNENSLVIFKDIKPGFEQVMSHLYLTMFNKVFSKVPEKDIFLD